MKTKLFAFLALFSFLLLSCQLEDDVTELEQEQRIETNDDVGKENTGNTGRIQCFGQPTCSGAVSIGVAASSERNTVLIMYEAPNGQPTFQYATKGSYLNREVKLYRDPVTLTYFFKIWFKNKYVPEPGMEYQQVLHPYTLDGVRVYDVNWSFQY